MTRPAAHPPMKAAEAAPLVPIRRQPRSVVLLLVANVCILQAQNFVG